MKQFLFLITAMCFVNTLSAQFIYTIKADSVKITNNCDTAELILENHTQNVLGFLYNKGKGRTEFRKAIKLNDSTLIFGEDTLVIRGTYKPWILTGNTGTNPANNFVGTIDTQALAFRTNNLERMRIHNNGNIGIATSTDNGNKFQVNGTGWFGNDLKVLHPTFATGSPFSGRFYWIADNTFRITAGPQENLTFGPSNAITSSSLFIAPIFYPTGSNGVNIYMPGAGGVYSTANNPANQNIIIHKFTSALPLATTGNGHPTLMELNMPVNRGETDGLETALRIRFTVTGTASALRALETVNGNVKLNTSSGMTSIGVDSVTAITSQLDINGLQGYNQLRLRKNYTPTSSSDTNGNTGDVSWDDNYIYIKTSAGWKRSALSTF